MNNTFKALCIILTLIGCSLQGHSQILMALLFGDKLNSDKLEFGLTLGNSFSYQTNFSDTKWRTRGFNVGLFFNVKLDKNNRWYAHTGAIPKTTLGFRYLPTYKTGDANIDAVIDSFDFEVERKVSYIQIPILARYRLFTIEKTGKKGNIRKNSFFIQGGPQIGLRTKAKDIFFAELEDDNNITFENSLKDDIRRFDVSVSAGLVWKFHKLIELAVSYNEGFLDIDDTDAVAINQSSGTNRNRFIMVNVNIPMGGEKKDKPAEGAKEKPAKEKKEKKPKGN